MGGKYQTTLSKAYYIGVFEVTQKQYQQVMGSHPSYENGSDFKEYLAKKIGSASDAWPVGNVSWIAIRGNSGWPASPEVTTDSFMGRLRTKTGLEFDLPTEAQWEYACRAGTTSTYNNGGNTTNDLNKIARWSENNQVVYYSRFHCPWTVGSYQPNAWGLYDMHGNVWEWCLDWYGTGLSGGTNPKGPSTGSRRILRGGGYGDKGYSASVYTSSYRESDNPSAGNYFYNSTRECFGFRIARMPQADEDR
jgi:formylglycine-generating enzyme required for sulfatase activity